MTAVCLPLALLYPPHALPLVLHLSGQRFKGKARRQAYLGGSGSAPFRVQLVVAHPIESPGGEIRRIRRRPHCCHHPQDSSSANRSRILGRAAEVAGALGARRAPLPRGRSRHHPVSCCGFAVAPPVFTSPKFQSLPKYQVELDSAKLRGEVTADTHSARYLPALRLTWRSSSTSLSASLA